MERTRPPAGHALTEEALSGLFGALSNSELLTLWAELMRELNDRGVIRSGNNPLGDYCEFLVAAKCRGIADLPNWSSHELSTATPRQSRASHRRSEAESGGS